MSARAFLVLEGGQIFEGRWKGGKERAGEVVFNTSHSGYEEMATDPSYYNQILVTTAPMQGNYGISDDVWESRKIWINGFVALEIQSSARSSDWLSRLDENNIPVVTELDTRRLVLHLRDHGTVWGALVKANTSDEALSRARQLISEGKAHDKDWAFAVSRTAIETFQGENPAGPKVAVVDFGCKENILRELKKRCREIRIYPVRSDASDILQWQPHGVLLSNGPGDPQDVKVAVDTVRTLLGQRFVFGICMGHQILSLALGATTKPLQFGHRGSNHPIKDSLLKRVYMTSQNHGYVVCQESLPADVDVTHVNLNDNTLAGIACWPKKCMSVQFHPESHPGPHDSEGLFDEFIKRIQ
ncbi:MAG: glutamine-hydrolyzing carbamoyl-phosphate synthase small subunit [Pseudobdellovibrionaceae bacterium]|nr:glutamine-hydrolyzing carbamoyl-phosphate synthase small subunit [Bdellovibrionales bacterium]USN47445.1 MAG: glutamine-hydrolyzing carbamoyl-phosphate synthase small subunit [Pseudobdellovibrionaceae bacterium]